MSFSVSDDELNHMLTRQAFRAPNQQPLHPFFDVSNIPDYSDDWGLNANINGITPNLPTNSVTLTETVHIIISFWVSCAQQLIPRNICRTLISFQVTPVLAILGCKMHTTLPPPTRLWHITSFL